MGGIARLVVRYWSIGAAGLPPRLARRMVLTNQITVFATLATLPYLVYYVIHDIRHYAPVILCNLSFIGSYGLVPVLNRAGKHDLARNYLVVAICAHLFSVTWLISAGSGVQFYYFSLAAVVGLLSVSEHYLVPMLLMGLASLLHVICYLAFPPGSSPVAILEPARHAVYITSVCGAVFLAGIFSFLFRREIDRAERELTRTNAELQRLSAMDPLTGLANRRALGERLEAELRRLRRRGQPIALLLCDVDFFKAYNDRYGHLAGDACLQRVAGVLSDVARRAADLVARYGGEEFVVVLPETDEEGALAVGEAARAGVRALGIPNDRSTVADVVTLSVGAVAVVTDGEVTPDELLRRADAALYDAKAGGRNRVVAWRPESDETSRPKGGSPGSSPMPASRAHA